MRVLFALLFAVLLPACPKPIGPKTESPPVVSAEAGLSLAFVLTKNVQVDEDKLVASAASMGLTLTPMPVEPGTAQFVQFSMGSDVFLIARMPAFPRADELARGPLSPGETEIAVSKAHLVLTTMSKTPRTLPELDSTMARLTAATIDASDATAAMLGHGMMLYRAEAFNRVVKGTEAGQIPVEICVDLTIVQEPNNRMSVLTHGLPRYGGEEVYVTGLASNSDVIGWAHAMARWMLLDPNKHFPTGDTLGRTAEEKILIQRVRHPAGEGPKVIKLELD